MGFGELINQRWQLIKQYIPSLPGRGRPLIDARRALNRILLQAGDGLRRHRYPTTAWQEIPEG